MCSHVINRFTVPCFQQGIDKQGKRLGPFYSDTELSAAILYFWTVCALLRLRSTLHTLRLLSCFHTEAYLGTSISELCATDSSMGFLNFQMNLDVKLRKPNCCCATPGGLTCETEENRHRRSFALRGLFSLEKCLFSPAWRSSALALAIVFGRRWIIYILISSLTLFEFVSLWSFFIGLGLFIIGKKIRQNKTKLCVTELRVRPRLLYQTLEHASDTPNWINCA